MKRNAFYIVLLLIVFSACTQQQASMKINITVQNNPEKQIVSLIGKDYGERPVIIDTVTLNAGNSTCHFETLISTESIYSIRFQKENRYILFSNDAPSIDMNVNWNDFAGYTVSSPASSSLKNLLVTYNGYLNDKETSAKDSTQALTDSIRNVQQQQALEKSTKATAYLSQYTDTTKSPAVALYALGILQQQHNDSLTMKPLIQKLVKRFPNDASINKLNADYKTWLTTQKGNPDIGKMAPVFAIPDTSGQAVSLQSYRGKYVLVDVWASFCEPCRKENPNVVNAFNTYKDKNFTILGVSLDTTKTAWLEAVHKDKLNWQHLSDFKQWKSSIVTAYNIESIPFNVLVDPEGKIIAKNLSGDTLQRKLAEVLK